MSRSSSSPLSREAKPYDDGWRLICLEDGTFWGPDGWTTFMGAHIWDEVASDRRVVVTNRQSQTSEIIYEIGLVAVKAVDAQATFSVRLVAIVLEL